MKITFTKKFEGGCPTYGDYYIQDRFNGFDIHGHGSYVYALYRRIPYTVTYQFSDQAAACEFLKRIALRSRPPVVNDNGDIVALNRSGSTLFKLDLKTLEISEKPLENERLSGWYQRYSECVAAAKEIIAKREEKK